MVAGTITDQRNPESLCKAHLPVFLGFPGLSHHECQPSEAKTSVTRFRWTRNLWRNSPRCAACGCISHPMPRGSRPRWASSPWRMTLEAEASAMELVYLQMIYWQKWVVFYSYVRLPDSMLGDVWSIYLDISWYIHHKCHCWHKKKRDQGMMWPEIGLKQGLANFTASWKILPWLGAVKKWDIWDPWHPWPLLKSPGSHHWHDEFTTHSPSMKAAGKKGQVGILPTLLLVKFAVVLGQIYVLIAPLATFGWRNLCFGWSHVMSNAVRWICCLLLGQPCISWFHQIEFGPHLPSVLLP